jgi:hypothetical protein
MGREKPGSAAARECSRSSLVGLRSMLGFDRLPPWLRSLQASGITLCALISCTAPAHSEVSVYGTVRAMRIEAQQAPLPEVLSALGASLGVRYSSLIELDEVIVAGTYSGTLEDVLRRMLKGLNYVIRTRDEAVEISIVGRPDLTHPPASSREPAPATNTNPAAQWRKPAAQKR